MGQYILSLSKNIFGTSTISILEIMLRHYFSLRVGEIAKIVFEPLKGFNDTVGIIGVSSGEGLSSRCYTWLNSK